MASRNRKGKIFNLFKDEFKITFMYKPTMELEDTFHYIILDDLIKLKIKLKNDTVIVIDDIIPLTSEYMTKTYCKLIELLINQHSFTVLVSLLGNTSAFTSTCVKYGAPIIEDDKYITIPLNVYTKLKQYYNNDISKYGFYILSVQDEYDTPEEQETVTSIGVKSMTDIFKEYMLESGAIISDTMESVDTITFDYKDIKFNYKYIDSRDTIELTNFVISDIASYVDLVKIFDILENFLDNCNNIVVRQVKAGILLKVCEIKHYQGVDEQDTPTNSMFKHTFGSFRVTRQFG